MGYDRPSPLLRIEFEQESLAGLWILHRPPTVAAFDAALELEDYSPIETVMAEDVRTLRPVSEQFAGLIESWNVERNGSPLPASSFLSLDALFVLQVTRAWTRIACGMPQVDAKEDEPGFDVSEIPTETLAS